MSINITAADHGAGGGINTAGALEPGTYECTLTSAQIYKNNKYQSEDEVTQVTLVWDTGYTADGDDGNEYPVFIHDSFLTFSFNEKANLTARLAALGHAITPQTAIQMDVDGITNLADLQHHKVGREARKSINELQVEGTTIFGGKANVTITVNDKGYPKVTAVTAPVKASGGGKLKPRKAAEPTEAPAGAPV